MAIYINNSLLLSLKTTKLLSIAKKLKHQRFETELDLKTDRTRSSQLSQESQGSSTNTANESAAMCHVSYKCVH
jgi:hypothetical protein